MAAKKKKTSKKAQGKPSSRTSSNSSFTAMRDYVKARLQDMQTMQQTYMEIAERVLDQGKYDPTQWLADVMKLYTVGWNSLLSGLNLPASSRIALVVDGGAGGRRSKTAKKAVKKAGKRRKKAAKKAT